MLDKKRKQTHQQQCFFRMCFFSDVIDRLLMMSIYQMLRRNNDLCQEEVVQLVLNSIYFFSLTFKNNARIKQISRMDVKVNHGNYESVDVVVVSSLEVITVNVIALDDSESTNSKITRGWVTASSSWWQWWCYSRLEKRCVADRLRSWWWWSLWKRREANEV